MKTNTHDVMTISASDVQNHFGQYLKELSHLLMPLVIVKHGHPIAVMLNYHVWQDQRKNLEQLHPWVVRCKKFVDKIKKSGRKQTPAVELIRQLREES